MNPVPQIYPISSKGHTVNLQHRSHRSRPIQSLFLILAATLLLTASQLTGGSAQSASQGIATGYFETVQGGSVISFISPHSVLHTPEGSFAGADGPTRFGAKLEESFTNLTFATRSTETVGEYVMIEFTLTGIHTGTYLDALPECAGVAVPGLAILHVGETGVSQQWISYDPGTVLSQIDAFGQIDASSRPTCDSQGLDQAEPAVASRPPCLALNACSFQP